MDWRTQAYQPLHLEKSSKGKPRPQIETSKCRVLSFFEEQADPKANEPKFKNEELVEWLRGLKETELQETEPKSYRDGFRLLMCGRPESADSSVKFSDLPFTINISRDCCPQDPPAQDPPAQGTPAQGTPVQNPPTQGTRKEYHRDDVLKLFCVHAHVGQVMKRRTPYFSVVDMSKGKIPLLIHPYTVYTAIFDTGLEGFKANLAFTSTYFPSDKTSVGIILGCTEQDVKKATTLLNECGSSRNHQLLLPAVFFELQRQRLASIRKSQTKNTIELQGNLEEIWYYQNGQKPLGYRLLAVSECAKDLFKLRADSIVMAEDLRIASRQLNRLKRHAEELAETRANELERLNKNPNEESPGDGEMESTSDNTHCFLDLLDEIAEDIVLFSGDVTINSNTATAAADEMTRISAKQDARSSMGLAFVAMAYLPITALATIFAMPVFDFKASWRDMDNQPSNWSESSGSDGPNSDSPSSSSPPVMSIYFTYWLVASLVLTLLTIESWWILSSDVRGWGWDRSLSLRQTVEWLKEIWFWVSERFYEIQSWFVLWEVIFRSWWQYHVKKQPDYPSIA
ncbi:hypothetical protein CDV31_004824 [Fusarium ambrosium]|uniref:Uncharacterized protein n=1 Tax=Fusarium ambrosium TaxID=131363 RepID=A0A428UN55_9HYPO|nr:hypothetical protein CDV31_004824 [Fusarium ambrosium]